MMRISLVVVSPVLGIFSYLIPRLRNEFCFLASVLSLYFSLLIFNATRQALTFNKVLWTLGNYEYGLYADHLTAVMLTLLSLSIFASIIYSFRYMRGYKNSGLFYFYTLLILAFGNALLTANSILSASVIAFIVSILGHLLSATTAEKEVKGFRNYSFLLIELFFILGILILKWENFTFNFAFLPINGTLNFKIIVGLILIFVSILARLGFYPFNKWFIITSNGFTLLGYLIFITITQKILGFYFLLRIGCFIFAQEHFLWLRIGLVILGVVNIILMGYRLWYTKQVNQVLFTTEAIQMGFVVLALTGLNSNTLAGGVLLFIYYLLSQTSIIYTLGSITYWTKSEKINDFIGLAERMPLTFILLTLAVFLIIGIPPLGSFGAKWLMLQGLFSFTNGIDIRSILHLVGMLGILIGNILMAGYFIKFLRKILEPLIDEFPKAWELGFTAWISPLMLLAIALFFGTFANNSMIKLVMDPLLRTTVFGFIEDSSRVKFEPSNNFFPTMIILSIILGYFLQKKYPKQIIMNSKC
ncbi:MAG: proton-conducting transporter membrane subunit [candidate division WOR-3 bacterium]